MPISHEDAIRADFDRLQFEKQRALADYEQARLCEDYDGVAHASITLREVEGHLHTLDRIASNYVMSRQQQQQGNRYGLSPDEVTIAHGIASNDPNMTADQREALYAQQKQKLQFMRATGQYRDDQGSVRR